MFKSSILRWCITILVVVGCLNIARSANAQSTGQRNVDVRTNARFNVGPLYVTPQLISVSFGVDTNVHNEADVSRPKSDFTAEFSPRVTLWVPMARRALLTTTMGGEYDYYKSFSRERSVGGTVAVRGDLFLRRFTVFAEAGLESTRTRPSHEIDSRIRRSTESRSAGIEVLASSKVSLQAEGFRNVSSYAPDALYQGVRLGETLNHTAQGARVTLTRRVTSLTTLGVLAEASETLFLESPDRNADSRRMGLTVELAPKALISGRAEVGVRQFRPRDARLPEFSGLVAKLGVTHRFRSATQFDVDWGRDVQFSYDPLRPYYLSNGIEVRIRRQLVGRYDIVGGASRTTYAYRAFEGVPLPDGGRILTNSITLDLGYRLTRQARLGFGATRWDRSGGHLIGAYEAYRFGFTLSYGY